MGISLIRLHAGPDQAVEQVVAPCPGGIEEYFLDVILAQAGSVVLDRGGCSAVLRLRQFDECQCGACHCSGNEREYSYQESV